MSQNVFLAGCCSIWTMFAVWSMFVDLAGIFVMWDGFFYWLLQYLDCLLLRVSFLNLGGVFVHACAILELCKICTLFACLE